MTAFTPSASTGNPPHAEVQAADPAGLASTHQASPAPLTPIPAEPGIARAGSGSTAVVCSQTRLGLGQRLPQAPRISFPNATGSAAPPVRHCQARGIPHRSNRPNRNSVPIRMNFGVWQGRTDPSLPFINFQPARARTAAPDARNATVRCYRGLRGGGYRRDNFICQFSDGAPRPASFTALTHHSILLGSPCFLAVKGSEEPTHERGFFTQEQKNV